MSIKIPGPGPEPPMDEWYCPYCGTRTTGSKCRVCGNQRGTTPPPPENLDISQEVTVTGDEALLGCRKRVYVSRTNETVNVYIPAGSISGERFRVPGHGLRSSDGSRRGDLTVTVKITQSPVPPRSNAGMLAWSIVTLLISTIPGIVALVKTVNAGKATQEEERQKLLRSAKIWNIVGCILGSLFIIGSIANLSGDSTAPAPTQRPYSAVETARPTATPRPTSKPKQTPQPTSAPDLTSSKAEEYLSNAKRLISSGDYYGAFGELFQCYALELSSSIEDECDTILYQIVSDLKSVEPKTGTELERTFQFQGGSEINVTADSGPAEMTVTSTADSSKYVRFYIREGQTATIPLPSQDSYYVTYKVGYVWFGDRTGFGDYCSNYDGGEIECHYSSDNAWVTNTVWTFII